MALFLTAWFVLACVVAFPLARALRGLSERQEAAARAAAVALPPAVGPMADADGIPPWTSPPRLPLCDGG